MSSLAGLVEVIIYSSPDDKKKNRGFCFLEYESHKAASLAKRFVLLISSLSNPVSLQTVGDGQDQSLEL